MRPGLSAVSYQLSATPAPSTQVPGSARTGRNRPLKSEIVLITPSWPPFAPRRGISALLRLRFGNASDDPHRPRPHRRIWGRRRRRWGLCPRVLLRIPSAPRDDTFDFAYAASRRALAIRSGLGPQASASAATGVVWRYHPNPCNNINPRALPRPMTNPPSQIARGPK